jgi:4-hydroxy-tetrahydrodipicolinate reductase
MKIALIGYGKMGKAIEAIALERNHTIDLIIDSKNADQFTEANLANCDVAIEFTHPEIAYNNVTKCLQCKIPTISGSTGWNAQLPSSEALCIQMDTALLVASNFSVGVNIFFALNKKLAQLMQHQTDYNVQVEEIHHTQKKDAPSGTAITLAEQIIDLHGSKKNWVLGATNDDAELSINSIREDPAPGTHTIHYYSPIDSIEIKHTAHNRTGFALGAVLAAEYIYNKKGVFTMQDVLQMS